MYHDFILQLKFSFHYVRDASCYREIVFNSGVYRSVARGCTDRFTSTPAKFVIITFSFLKHWQKEKFFLLLPGGGSMLLHTRLNFNNILTEVQVLNWKKKKFFFPRFPLLRIKFLQARSHTWRDLPLSWYFKKHCTRAAKFSQWVSSPYSQNSLILHLCRRTRRSCSTAESIIFSTSIHAWLLGSHFTLLLSNFSRLSKSSHL